MASTRSAVPGARFSAWTVIADAEHGANWQPRWLCKCDCGTERVNYATNIFRGLSKSCGCAKKNRLGDAKRTHGMTGTPTYSSWVSMFTRCENPNSKSFLNYGGRGIKVCERWKSFENFFADMGEKPVKGMSIDRLDVNGNYEPGNCEWSTPTKQARNTRKTRLTPSIVADLRSGRSSISEIVAATGCSQATASHARTGRNWKDGSHS